MIFQKIFTVERRLKSDTVTDGKKLEALESIKDLLSMIDHKTECIPATDPVRLIALLSDLKGAPLTSEENTLAEEIVNTGGEACREIKLHQETVWEITPEY